MGVLNTDLLPPLFDQILTHYTGPRAPLYARDHIIRALENGILNAVAERQRAALKVPGYTQPAAD